MDKQGKDKTALNTPNQQLIGNRPSITDTSYSVLFLYTLPNDPSLLLNQHREMQHCCKWLFAEETQVFVQAKLYEFGYF